MTRKSRRESLRESLSSAVRPPEPNPKLDEILGRYAGTQSLIGQPPPEPAAEAAAEPSRVPTPVAERPPSPSGPGHVAAPVAGRDPGPEKTPPPPSERPRSPHDPSRMTKGHTSVTNHLLDDILPTLDPPDQAVLLRLYRLSRGFRQARCKVSLAALITKTNVKRTRLKEALRLLEARGHIRRLHDDVENPDNYNRGMNFEMLLEGPEGGRLTTGVVSRPGSSDGPIKDKGFKDNSKNEAAAPKDCPDCRGTGMWYPEGFEKGVAKCRHERLEKGKS